MTAESSNTPDWGAVFDSLLDWLATAIAGGLVTVRLRQRAEQWIDKPDGNGWFSPGPPTQVRDVVWDSTSTASLRNAAQHVATVFAAQALDPDQLTFAAEVGIDAFLDHEESAAAREIGGRLFSAVASAKAEVAVSVALVAFVRAPECAVELLPGVWLRKARQADCEQLAGERGFGWNSSSVNSVIEWVSPLGPFPLLQQNEFESFLGAMTLVRLGGPAGVGFNARRRSDPVVPFQFFRHWGYHLKPWAFSEADVLLFRRVHELVKDISEQAMKTRFGGRLGSVLSVAYRHLRIATIETTSHAMGIGAAATALEATLSDDDKQLIGFKLRQRSSILLKILIDAGGTSDLVNRAYAVRSAYYHGASNKKTLPSDDLARLREEFVDVVRQVLLAVLFLATNGRNQRSVVDLIDRAAWDPAARREVETKLEPLRQLLAKKGHGGT